MKSIFASRVDKIAKAVVADAIRRTAGTGNFPADADFAFQADYDPDDTEIQQWYEDNTGETIDWDDSESVDEYKEWIYQKEADDDSEVYDEVKSAIDDLPTYAFWAIELDSGYYAGFCLRIIDKDSRWVYEDEADGILEDLGASTDDPSIVYVSKEEAEQAIRDAIRTNLYVEADSELGKKVFNWIADDLRQISDELVEDIDIEGVEAGDWYVARDVSDDHGLIELVDEYFKDKEYDEVYNAVKRIAKDNGMKSYAHGGTFSNGETIYRLNDID